MTCPGIPTGWSSASGAFTASGRRRSATCGTWSPVRRARARSSSGSLRNWRKSARRWVGRSSTCWAGCASRTSPYANWCCKPSATATSRRCAPGSTRRWTTRWTASGCVSSSRSEHWLVIRWMPASIRSRDRQIGAGEAVLPRYERITFEKALISMPGKPLAAFVCPGHPLLDATIDLVLERYRDLLKRGAVLVDPNDPGEEPRALVYLEHVIQDARTDRAGNRRVVSRQMQFVELDAAGTAHMAGYAPYLDYRPLREDEHTLIEPVLTNLLLREQIEQQALTFAITALVPQHLAEVKGSKEELIRKTMAAVKDRLTKEINYWDHRA